MRAANAVAMSLLMAAVVLQFAPPARQEGYPFGNKTAEVRLDVYLDLHCPDSSDFFAVLLKAREGRIQGKALKELIDIRVHLFPLPYHYNSFAASSLAKWFELLHPDKYPAFVQLQFDSIEKYTSKALGLSVLEVRKLLINDGIAALAGEKDDSIYNVFEDQNIQLKTRGSYKFGSYTGVTGTPNYAVNGVLIQDEFSSADSLVRYFEPYFNNGQSRLATLAQ